jgi:hypothetical protein
MPSFRDIHTGKTASLNPRAQLRRTVWESRDSELSSKLTSQTHVSPGNALHHAPSCSPPKESTIQPITTVYRLPLFLSPSPRAYLPRGPRSSQGSHLCCTDRVPGARLLLHHGHQGRDVLCLDFGVHNLGAVSVGRPPLRHGARDRRFEIGGGGERRSGKKPKKESARRSMGSNPSQTCLSFRELRLVSERGMRPSRTPSTNPFALTAVRGVEDAL